MTLVACTDSSTCASGLVCAPYSPSPSLPGFNCPARTCQPSCEKAGCASDEVCGADGVCRLTKCDEPGAPACAEHYRCDPAAAPAMVTTVVNGSSATDAAAPQHEAQRGCIRKLCDEPDGFVCKDNWSCDPANVPVNEGSGCVPLSCKETGHCQDDSLSICEPTNDGPRAAGTDLHGCVVRNCGEGRVCRHIKDSVNYAYCDLESPEADAAGCVVKSCEEMPEVCSGRICDRGSPIGDAFGCRALDCHDPG